MVKELFRAKNKKPIIIKEKGRNQSVLISYGLRK